LAQEGSVEDPAAHSHMSQQSNVSMALFLSESEDPACIDMHESSDEANSDAGNQHVSKAKTVSEQANDVAIVSEQPNDVATVSEQPEDVAIVSEKPADVAIVSEKKTYQLPGWCDGDRGKYRAYLAAKKAFQNNEEYKSKKFPDAVTRAMNDIKAEIGQIRTDMNRGFDAQAESTRALSNRVEDLAKNAEEQSKMMKCILDQSSNRPAIENGDKPLAIENGDQPLAIDDGDKPLAIENGDKQVAIENGDEPLAIENGDKQAAIENGDEPTTSAGSNATVSELAEQLKNAKKAAAAKAAALKKAAAEKKRKRDEEKTAAKKAKLEAELAKLK